MSWEKRRKRLKKNKAGVFFLWTLSLLYGVAVALRRWTYALGILRQKRLPGKVLCIGNITTGGTGKTPTVLLAAQTYARHGVHVSILTRGYGRMSRDKNITTLLDDDPPSWTDCGDEPWMMHHALRGQNIPILVSPNRFKAGTQAITFYHSKVLILDDGFQHLSLKHDLDVVLINATDPIAEARLLPLGNLREPLWALRRAHLILLTHTNMLGDAELKALHAQIQAINPKAPILESAHETDFLLDLKTEKKYKPSHVQGEKVVALSGIADPASFENMLTELGAQIVQKWRYPDHHPYLMSEMRAIEKLRAGHSVITTFKDMTRLPKGWQDAITGGMFALAIKLNITKGRQIWLDHLSALAK